MGTNTGISWTDHTWNPWLGCRKTSTGCKNCYMYREQKFHGKDPSTVVSSKTTYLAPLKWKEPARVFTCSYSDFFIEEADEWRIGAWDIIRKTPHLTYQILTKRPERISACLPPDWGSGWDNVWLGVTTENQEMADLRIPELLENEAKVFFVSYEPALSALNLEPYLQFPPFHENYKMTWGVNEFHGIDWIIIGGESGPGYRTMEISWAMNLINQCKDAEVPVFFKQIGGWPDVRKNLDQWPDELKIQQFPINHEIH